MQCPHCSSIRDSRLTHVRLDQCTSIELFDGFIILAGLRLHHILVAQLIVSPAAIAFPAHLSLHFAPFVTSRAKPTLTNLAYTRRSPHVDRFVDADPVVQFGVLVGLHPPLALLQPLRVPMGLVGPKLGLVGGAAWCSCGPLRETACGSRPHPSTSESDTGRGPRTFATLETPPSERQAHPPGDPEATTRATPEATPGRPPRRSPATPEKTPGDPRGDALGECRRSRAPSATWVFRARLRRPRSLGDSCSVRNA